MKTKILFFVLAFCALLFNVEIVKATTYQWTGGAGTTNWTTAANWLNTTTNTSNNGYPGSLGTTDIAQVLTSNITISLTGSVTISSLTTTNYGTSGLIISFSGSPILTITGGLTMAQPSSLTNVITFSGTGTAVISGTSAFAYYGEMSISAGTTVTFASGSILNFTNNQGALTNNGTLNLTSSTFNFGYNSILVSPGTVIANNSTFNLSGSPSYITYGGKFVSNSCTFTMPSGAYIKSTSTSSAFTATTSTFTMSGSGGAAYIYNNGTFRDHGSTYNLSGQSAYIQNVASSSMHVSGTIVNFTGSSNAQYITNAGTFTADSASKINATTYQSYLTNSGTFYAGTSGSACVITLSAQSANVSNTGTFDLGSTSIIYPTGYTAYVTNTSPGVFTLQSDVNGSAAIGALSATATCNGTFNVQRYFQGSTTYDNTTKLWIERNYRIISPNVHNSTQVNSNNVYGLNYIVGSTAGETTTANSLTNSFITGCTGGSTSAGNPSIYLFRESLTPDNSTFTDGNFLGITNITNSSTSGTITCSDGNTYSIPVGNGVFFYFRGAATDFSTRTVNPFIAPESVTLTSTGLINQQTITVKDWYSPTSSNLGYTGTGTTGNYKVRGYNMVGNPYPCSIDWNTSYSGTGIIRTNINPTMYVFNPVTSQYNSYITTSASGGTGTGNATNIIASGQGFFVQANTTGSSLVFTEAAKSATSLPTGSNLLMGTPAAQVAGTQLMRLKLLVDSLNYDDIAISFNSSASPKYNPVEDAAYLKGDNAKEGLSSLSSDSVGLSINSLPLPNLIPELIRLHVDASINGTYTFQKTMLDAIPQLFEIWLMDNLKKDSLDIRNNSTYAFDVDISDTSTYGSNRFQLVIRQNPALMVRLLNFTGTKATDGALIVWKTENEQNYTNFTVERSTDGGVTFNILGGFASSSLGTYSFLDKNPAIAANRYRLKMVDLNGTVTYSNIVILSYANTSNIIASNLLVYPNPTSNIINIAIQQNNNSAASDLSTLETASLTPGLTATTVNDLSYAIKIMNITGSVVKTASSSQPTWQDSVANLTPGTYIIQVISNKDNSVVGRSTFIKL